MTPSPSPSIEARLCDALEAIYREFESPVPLKIEGCPCCIARRRVDVLLTTPIRELTGRNLYGYVSGVFYTVGDECDFRYLLPRILDISVNHPEDAIEPEIVLLKLGKANWQSWSDSERRAIEEFVDAWFEQMLAQDLAGADNGWIDRDAESILCGAACAGFPLARWLIRLQEPFAAPVLADLKRAFLGKPPPFWDYAPAGLKELSAVLAQGQA